MKKRIISLVLGFSLLLSLIVPAGAVFEENYIDMDDDGNAAISMTTDQFISIFVDNYVTQTDVSEPTSAHSTLYDNGAARVTIENIEYDPVTQEIEFSSDITLNGDTTSIGVTGILYNSRKQANGIDSIIGKLASSNQAYNIIHFEIYNSTSIDDFNADPSYSGVPHLKYYILTEENEIILAETSIPAELRGIVIDDSNGITNSDAVYDGFWFTHFVDGTFSSRDDLDIQSTNSQQAINNTDVAAPMSAGGYETYYLNEVIMTWNIAGTPYIYNTTPFIMHYMPDVSTYDATWKVLFGTTGGYCTVNGQIFYLTGIRLKNIKLSVAAGPYTEFVKAVTYINLLSDSGGDISSFLGIFSAIASAASLSATATATAIMSSLLSATGTSCSFSNGVEVKAFPPFARAFSVEVPSTAAIQHNYSNGEGQYLQYLITAVSDSYYKSGTSGNRTGRIQVSFTAEAGASTKSVTDNVDFTYYCTVSTD